MSLDRPREKMRLKGVESLSDYELLMAIIGSGNKQADVTKIAHELYKIITKDRDKLTYKLLKEIKGLGNAKIAEILASFELSKRLLKESELPILSSSEQVASQVIEINDKKQEYFICLTLDGANRLIAKRLITIGTLNASLSHPREVFADAITDRAAGIIVVHNHPSSTLRPSDNDITITERLVEAGELLGIKLIDHVIVAKNKYFSFEEQGLLK